MPFHLYNGTRIHYPGVNGSPCALTIIIKNERRMVFLINSNSIAVIYLQRSINVENALTKIKGRAMKMFLFNSANVGRPLSACNKRFCGLAVQAA